MLLSFGQIFLMLKGIAIGLGVWGAIMDADLTRLEFILGYRLVEEKEDHLIDEWRETGVANGNGSLISILPPGHTVFSCTHKPLPRSPRPHPHVCVL